MDFPFFRFIRSKEELTELLPKQKGWNDMSWNKRAAFAGGGTVGYVMARLLDDKEGV